MSDCLGTAGDARIGSDIDLVGLVPSISINRCHFKVPINACQSQKVQQEVNSIIQLFVEVAIHGPREQGGTSLGLKPGQKVGAQLKLVQAFGCA